MSNANTNIYYLAEMEELAARKRKLAERKKRYYDNKARAQQGSKDRANRFVHCF